jgi:hypothetical protein
MYNKFIIVIVEPGHVGVSDEGDYLCVALVIVSELSLVLFRKLEIKYFISESIYKFNALEFWKKVQSNSDVLLFLNLIWMILGCPLVTKQ